MNVRAFVAPKALRLPAVGEFVQPRVAVGETNKYWYDILDFEGNGNAITLQDLSTVLREMSIGIRYSNEAIWVDEKEERSSHLERNKAVVTINLLSHTAVILAFIQIAQELFPGRRKQVGRCISFLDKYQSIINGLVQKGNQSSAWFIHNFTMQLVMVEEREPELILSIRSRIVSFDVNAWWHGFKSEVGIFSFDSQQGKVTVCDSVSCIEFTMQQEEYRGPDGENYPSLEVEYRRFLRNQG